MSSTQRDGGRRLLTGDVVTKQTMCLRVTSDSIWCELASSWHLHNPKKYSYVRIKIIQTKRFKIIKKNPST